MRGFPFDATEIAILAFLLFVAVLFFVAVGCAPHTDLYAEATTGGGDPAGGSAAGALVDPPAGASGVPDNLAGVVVRLPVAIAVGSAGFRLQPSPEGDGAGAGAAPLGAPDAAPCAIGVAGSCYRVPIAGALAPNRTYLLELLAGTTDLDGAPATTGGIGAFDTGDSADDVAPQVTDFAVALAGPCVGVRFSTDEPVAAEVALRADAAQAITAAGTGQSVFDLAVPFTGLAPGARAQVLLRVTDRAGNRSESIAGEVDVPLETPPLVITEVLANPAGTEPGQEFVELRNIGGADLPLAGLRLEDSKGGDVLPEASLASGAYALVVPSAFDPQSPRDVTPRPGTLMIPVDARLGSDGLSNGGEVVRLRMPGTAMEPIISSYGGWVDVSAASAAGKSVHRLEDDACDHPSAWTRPPRAATPGWGTP
jgi:hypothetical protein